MTNILTCDNFFFSSSPSKLILNQIKYLISELNIATFAVFYPNFRKSSYTFVFQNTIFFNTFPLKLKLTDYSL